jgi:MFS family permease
VRYRTICIISTVFYVVAGTLPYFCGTSMGFGGLLASRFVFGLAVGFFTPLTNALVSHLYDDEDKRASALGYGNAMFSVGGILSQLIGGYLCLVSCWQSSAVCSQLACASAPHALRRTSLVARTSRASVRRARNWPWCATTSGGSMQMRGLKRTEPSLVRGFSRGTGLGVRTRAGLPCAARGTGLGARPRAGLRCR